MHALGTPLVVFALAFLLASLAPSPAEACGLSCRQAASEAGARRAPKKRVTLDVYEADLHNLIRLFADVSGLNFVVADDVQGKVTIKLRDVPWDEALEAILSTKGLAMDRKGNIIRVLPKARLDAERKAALELEEAKRRSAPLQTKIVPVSYARAEELVPLVKEVLTERGKVTYDKRTNVLIIRDVAGSAALDF